MTPDFQDRSSRRTPTPTAQRLAERYGVDPLVMEEIISGEAERVADAPVRETTPPASAGIFDIPAPIASAPASSWIDERTFPGMKTAPTPENTPPVATAPRKVSISSTPISEEPRPVSVKTASTELSGGLVLAILVAIGIAIAVLFSFNKGCFRQRSVASRNAALLQSQADTEPPPIQPSNVVPPGLPPESTQIPRETPTDNLKPNASPAAVKKPAPKRLPNPVALRTTSDFDAEERLAALRADGNSRAYIKKSTTHGVTKYEVRTRR